MVLRNVANAEEVEIDLFIKSLADLTVNDKNLVPLISKSLCKITGEDCIIDEETQSTTCEDFSFYA